MGGMGRASVRLSPAAEFFLSSTGLCPPFTAASLKQAFRKGVGKLHPDVRPGVAAGEDFGRAGEVLAHIEAGGHPEGLGEPISIGERQLDLLRVASRGGKVEVLLMGERIWPQPAL